MARSKKTDDERQARLDKWAGRLDPSGSIGQASLIDTGDSRTGRLREAQRDYQVIRLLDELLKEQQEATRLLRKIAGEASDLDRMPPPAV